MPPSLLAVWRKLAWDCLWLPCAAQAFGRSPKHCATCMQGGAEAGGNSTPNVHSSLPCRLADNYYLLPFCRPKPAERPRHKWGGLGEVLQVRAVVLWAGSSAGLVLGARIFFEADCWFASWGRGERGGLNGWQL